MSHLYKNSFLKLIGRLSLKPRLVSIVNIIAVVIVIVFSGVIPTVSYATLLNASTFEFTRSVTVHYTLAAKTPLTLAISPSPLTGSIHCYNAYSGAFLFEAEINQTITIPEKIYTGANVTCIGEITPSGVEAYHWSLQLNGTEVITFNTNVTHAECSANVQSINLGILEPDTIKTFNLPVTTSGGDLTLTTNDMAEGVIKLGGSEDVIIKPKDNITSYSTGEWRGITENSTISVVTSPTAAGIYTSTATLTLTCN